MTQHVEPSATRALFGALIDYAGLFPPAQLPLASAVAEYAQHLAEPEAWMLGRFICPASQLMALGALWPAGQPLRVAALGAKTATPAECQAGLADTLAAVTAFRAAHGAYAQVDVLEIPLPPLAHPAEAQALLTAIHPRIRQHGLTVFYEAALSGPDAPAQLTHALAALSAEREAGFKLRTGGVTASAVPPVELVMAALTGCQRYGLPLKFTAGLHQPLRHFDDALQTHVYGFMNVVVGALMARAHRLQGDLLHALLVDENPTHFRLSARALSWHHYELSLGQISALRRAAAVGFGSCSFAEPREALHALEWFTA